MTKTPNEASSEFIGKKAAAFSLPDQEGKMHKLSDYKGKFVVLFWYPKDGTPGFVFTHEKLSSELAKYTPNDKQAT